MKVGHVEEVRAAEHRLSLRPRILQGLVWIGEILFSVVFAMPLWIRAENLCHDVRVMECPHNCIETSPKLPSDINIGGRELVCNLNNVV